MVLLLIHALLAFAAGAAATVPARRWLALRRAAELASSGGSSRSASHPYRDAPFDAAPAPVEAPALHKGPRKECPACSSALVVSVRVCNFCKRDVAYGHDSEWHRCGGGTKATIGVVHRIVAPHVPAVGYDLRDVGDVGAVRRVGECEGGRVSNQRSC